jgi:hypothetical protein
MMTVLLLIFLVSAGSLDLKLTQPFMQAVSFLVVFLFNGFLIASVSFAVCFSRDKSRGRRLLGGPHIADVDDPTLLVQVSWFSTDVCAPACRGSGGDLHMPCSITTPRSRAVRRHQHLLHDGLPDQPESRRRNVILRSSRRENPIRIASSQGASLTFLGSMVYLTIGGYRDDPALAPVLRDPDSATAYPGPTGRRYHPFGGRAESFRLLITLDVQQRRPEGHVVGTTEFNYRPWSSCSACLCPSCLLLPVCVAALPSARKRFRYSDEAERRLWRRGLEQYRAGSSYLAAVEWFRPGM